MPPGGGEPIKYTIPSNPKEAFASLFNGRMSVANTALYYYFLIDLLTMKLTRSNKAIRDRVSRVGAARDRWYLANELLALEQENTLKASAIPVCELSAMTAQIISGCWMMRPRPLLSVLPNDLHTSFIEPLETAASQAGVRILFGHRVEKVLVSAEDRVEGVMVMGRDG